MFKNFNYHKPPSTRETQDNYPYFNSRFNKKTHPLRFTEKHLIESLNVNAVMLKKPVMFYNMLNQGNKRGKETQVLSLDCERILTEKGEQLARVSIVNYYGNIVFDTLVKPCMSHDEPFDVVDYREWITGIKPIDLQNAPSFGNIAPIVSFDFIPKLIFIICIRFKRS